MMSKTAIRAAVHALNAAHTHISLAAHLTVQGHYSLADLEKAIAASKQRSEMANDMVRSILNGEDAERVLFPLAISDAEIEKSLGEVT